MFVDNLRLDVIATFEDNEQEHFSCAIWKSAIRSEKKLINYIKKHLLKDKDLVKLSLCWLCDENVVKSIRLFKKALRKMQNIFLVVGQNKERRNEMEKYKIKYQDTQTSYYLDIKFDTEEQAEEYIKENNLNSGYSFFTIE